MNQALGIRTEAAKAAIPAASMKKVKREQNNTVPLPKKKMLPNSLVVRKQQYLSSISV